MTPEQVKAALLAQQADIEARLQRTHRHIHQREAPVSPTVSEQAKETENDDLVMALDHEGQVELRQIRQALTRLEAGEYFNCALCGGEIGEARLKAIPHTSLCIGCASTA